MRGTHAGLLGLLCGMVISGCECLNSERFRGVELDGKALQVACEGEWSCAVTDAKALWCWGAYPHPSDTYPPRANSPVRLEGQGWVEVAGDYLHACARKDDGSLWCWGTNWNGELGQGSLSGSGAAAPVRVGTESDWTAVNAGNSFTCGLRAPGTLWCWGGNNVGQLGLGTTTPLLEGVATPTQVGQDSDWVAVSAGDLHACALKKDGRAFCWGSGKLGALGTGREEDSLTPTAVAGDHSFTAVSAGWEATCGIDGGGALWCWGHNLNGKLPLGADGPFGEVLVPTRVEAEVSWKQVVLGGRSGCALSREGAPYCWYEREWGTPRGGEHEWTGSPVRVTAGDGLTSICESGEHACVTTDDGEVMCSGSDDNGQLGDGTSGGGGGGD